MISDALLFCTHDNAGYDMLSLACQMLFPDPFPSLYLPYRLAVYLGAPDLPSLVTRWTVPPNQSILPTLIQLINQPILIAFAPRRPGEPVGPRPIRPPIPRFAPAAEPTYQAPWQAPRHGRDDDDDDVARKGEHAGPQRVVGELAPAALVEDDSLVEDAAEEVG